MRLSDPVLVYGDPTSSTHILVQKKETEKHPLYYAPREVNGKIACYTRFPEAAKYFDIRSFAEEDFHEVINNVHPSELVNIIFCNFGDKNPNEVSRNDIYDYIYYEKQNFFGYFSTFLTELKDSFISQREVIDSILVKPKENKDKKDVTPEPEKQKYEFLPIVEEFDENQIDTFIDRTEKNGKIVVTIGVLKKYNLKKVQKYSDQLEPNQTITIKGKSGLKYTDKFEHPFGDHIIKEAIAPIVQTSIYEYFEPEISCQKNNFLTASDLKYPIDELLNVIDNLPQESEYEVNKYFIDTTEFLMFKNKKPSVRIKLDPDILNDYPNVQLGSIISKSESSIGIVPSNKIVSHITEDNIVKDVKLDIAPTSKYHIPIETLLDGYLHSKLYNIPIKQIKYKAKWLSGHITDYDTKSKQKYQTPFEATYTNNKINNLYGISIDVSNVAKRSDLVDLLRYLLIEYVAKSVRTDTTISVEFGERIIVKIEPFYKKIYDDDTTLYIHAEVRENPDIHNFTKQKWNQLYSKWANKHRDLLKSNELDQKLDIEKFWSIHKNKVQTDQRIEPPKDDVMICYINYHPVSKDLKIGRSKSWESRYSLYTRAKPPVDTIDPDCILRYYLKCPIHKDAVITDYLYVCMEDFFKQFSDKQEYLKRHKSPSGHTTEYYSLETEKDINDQLNEYVADITDAFLNLTLKDLSDVRKPSIKGDGIHGGKRQEFFNKVNQYTKEKMYDVENALQIIANLDDTKKLKDYDNFEKRFLPKFK